MAVTHTLVFSDGTGQRGVPDTKTSAPDTSTNVHRMYLAAREVPSQRCFYDAGLGSDPEHVLDWLTSAKNFLAKTTGLGITRNIRECYEFLIREGEPGRRIGLFGFSRGAYTVRSLGGLLGLCGVPAPMQGGVDIRGVGKPETALRGKIIDEAISIYQTYGPEKKQLRKDMGAAFKAKYKGWDAIPTVIGVFDTVESLGLPGVADLFNPFAHRFHDANLNPKVPFGFQALSVDENRDAFRPEIWEQRFPVAGQTIEQVWFPGVHSDVGGGYAERGLSDATLQWMVANCGRAGIDIAFRFKTPPKPDILGPQHDERSGFGKFWWKRERGEYIRKEAVDVDPLAGDIERRFKSASHGYRPSALRDHPRTSGFY
jgi:uncharacterized protein (DUF2235 family)